MDFPDYAPPQTRTQTLAWAHEFAPNAGLEYAQNRNRLVVGHPFVSRLAPSIRVRLASETEISQIAIAHFGSLFGCEKWLQEIYWRNYWRSWLELRPQIWLDYTQKKEKIRAELSPTQREQLKAVESGQSGVAVMDKFARELVETGYLHNHARMWLAGFWIHTERLPWHLGADFFERHLLCACAASNTLSWRWVAGTQTRGKPYLARRSNLEKYCDDFYLNDPTGLERLENPHAAPIPEEPVFAPSPPKLQTDLPVDVGKTGLWITEDDFAPETSALKEREIAAVGVSIVEAPAKSEFSNGLRRDFRWAAAGDAAARAQTAWGAKAQIWTEFAPSDLLDFALENQLETVVCLRPFVGPTSDLLPTIKALLESRGVRFFALRRGEDAALLPFAEKGFFKFWEAVKARELSP